METPVVFCVFNRPSLTRQVFQRIAEAQPPQLLVVADGPRPGREGEAERCREVREIATAVDWPCEVLTDFAQQNLGCRKRLVTGLNWAFSHVEEAIILEDDILPDPSFFRFCQEMLAQFRDDLRVSMITGFNQSSARKRAPESYFFSEMTHIWGWATWRSRWAQYDELLLNWPQVRRQGLLTEVFPKVSAVQYWTDIFDQMHAGTGPNTWDYQWMYTNLCRRWLAVTPQVNLVQNLGFGADATHSTDPDGVPRVNVSSLSFPLSHPATMIASRSLDAIDQEMSGWHKPALPKRAVRKVRRILRRRKAKA